MGEEKSVITKVQRNPNSIKLDVQISPHITKEKTNEEIRDTIASRLSRKTVKPLILSNYSDRYFDAIFTDTSEIDMTNDELATTTLAFSVPDGLAHAIDKKSFSILTNADGERYFHIENNGTAPVRVDFDLVMSKDTETFGLVTDDAITQIGT